MKKLLCVCAVGLLLTFMTTSCDKKCECKTYYDGVLEKTEDPFTVEGGKKCTDYNQSYTMPLVGTKVEVKCQTTL